LVFWEIILTPVFLLGVGAGFTLDFGDWFLERRSSPCTVDLELRRWAGEGSSLPALIPEVRAFPHQERVTSLVRGALRLRLPTRRLVRVASEVLENSHTIDAAVSIKSIADTGVRLTTNLS
jgi:hypothetical protein